MTYEEHIQKAEELLAGTYCHATPFPADGLKFQVARAQAHATIALAMAQADRSTGVGSVELRPAVSR